MKSKNQEQRQSKTVEEKKKRYELFSKYPDMVNRAEFAEMLGIGRNKSLEMLKSGVISSVKIGSNYRIPKCSVVDFVVKSCNL